MAKKNICDVVLKVGQGVEIARLPTRGTEIIYGGMTSRSYFRLVIKERRVEVGQELFDSHSLSYSTRTPQKLNLGPEEVDVTIRKVTPQEIRLQYKPHIETEVSSGSVEKC